MSCNDLRQGSLSFGEGVGVAKRAERSTVIVAKPDQHWPLQSRTLASGTNSRPVTVQPYSSDRQRRHHSFNFTFT
jgi:hypothetical protein